MYPDLSKISKFVENEIGCLKGLELKIKFKGNYHPVFYKQCPVMFVLNEAVNSALEDGIGKGDWIHTQFNYAATAIVPVRKSKNGKIRICDDYSVSVNKFLEDDGHPIPLSDELLCQRGR
ncbi:hypothetical protein RF11_05788 [Thelohanellus kitauei]|uniref:Uncharacterized protein n=1 Tax=Thelohanellus kitauei TaxID=669202 RepID=A0A0C2MHC9_THEKT|nr:hypothetical protein RF11_05788 [Thelohanellus kitauei]